MNPKIRFFTLLIAASLLLGLASCGPREYKTYALADFCDTANAGEYVTVSGVLKIPETVLEYEKTYSALLVEDINQPQPYMRIGIRIGNGNNQMQTLTDNFTLEDIVIRTDDGQIVTYGDAISVSGFYGGACGAGNSDFKADVIETK